MTITEPNPIAFAANEAVRRRGFDIVAVDVYRDIHKGIRTELFAVTSEAGSLDPADGGGRVVLATHVSELVTLLVDHAAHEDGGVQPVLEVELPALAEKIASDHEVIDARLGELEDLAASAVEATGAGQRAGLYRLYLELASFTSTYLEHQDVEERVVMPALEQAIGVEAVVDLHRAIVSNIPPDKMATSMALMLPAMNVEDRTEMLGGMQADAPAEVFAGIWSLAGSVLSPSDHRELGARLGLS